MKATGKRILIDPTPIEKVTKAGIIIPVKAEEKSSSGKVISIGGEVKEVKVGDIVHFNKNVAIDLTLNETKYLTIREEEVYVRE